jgi:hypothetical protein
MIVLYRSTLLCSDAGDFLPITQQKPFTFRSVFFFWLNTFLNEYDIFVNFVLKIQC